MSSTSRREIGTAGRVADRAAAPIRAFETCHHANARSSIGMAQCESKLTADFLSNVDSPADWPAKRPVYRLLPASKRDAVTVFAAAVWTSSTSRRRTMWSTCYGNSYRSILSQKTKLSDHPALARFVRLLPADSYGLPASCDRNNVRRAFVQ